MKINKLLLTTPPAIPINLIYVWEFLSNIIIKVLSIIHFSIIQRRIFRVPFYLTINLSKYKTYNQIL